MVFKVKMTCLLLVKEMQRKIPFGAVHHIALNLPLHMVKSDLDYLDLLLWSQFFTNIRARLIDNILE